jgi:hypothetical protein
VSFVLAVWRPAACWFESSSFFSQVFEDRHFTEGEISLGTLNQLRRTWIDASGLEDSAKTPPDYGRITIFAQATQATDIEQAKIATPFVLSLSRRSPSATRVEV